MEVTECTKGFFYDGATFLFGERRRGSSGFVIHGVSWVVGVNWGQWLVASRGAWQVSRPSLLLRQALRV